MSYLESQNYWFDCKIKKAVKAMLPACFFQHAKFSHVSHMSTILWQSPAFFLLFSLVYLPVDAQIPLQVASTKLPIYQAKLQPVTDAVE